MLILTNLTYLYDHISMHFSFTAKKGEKLAVLGPSGSGKSTLLSLIAGFLPSVDGELILNTVNHNMTLPSKRPVSILFQENNLFPHLTVFQNISLGLHPKLKLNYQQKNEVKDIIKYIELSNHTHHLPNQLSGGERQRVAIARCLVRKQPILLLDEPFSALDPALRKKMLHLVDKICHERNITLLIVLHNIEDAIHIAKRSLLIVNGKVCWDGMTSLLKDGYVSEAKILGIPLEKNLKYNFVN